MPIGAISRDGKLLVTKNDHKWRQAVAGRTRIGCQRTVNSLCYVLTLNPHGGTGDPYAARQGLG